MINNKINKISAVLLVAAMTTCLCACGSKTVDTSSTDAANTADAANTSDSANTLEPAFASTAEVTVAIIAEALTPTKIHDKHTVFSYSYDVSNSGEDDLDSAAISNIHEKTNDIYEYSYLISYSDGVAQNVYFSTESDDNNIYIIYNGESQVMPRTQEDLDTTIYGPILGISEENAKITSIEEKDGKYVATLEVNEETIDSTVVATIDPQSGDITDIVYSYPSYYSEGDTVVTFTFNYDASQTVDRSAKESNSGSDTASNSGSSSSTDGMLINTTDINGNPFTMDDIKNAKVIMVNFWEPWCGPCVGEMPDIQKLYENYKDQGLLVLGVYSTFDMQADAEDIVSSKGITYPILKCDDNLQKFEQDYVPATFFIDSTGKLLSSEPVAGSQSYEDWEKTVQEYLK